MAASRRTSRLDAPRAGPVQVHLDVDDRLRRLHLDLRIHDTAHRGDRTAHLLGGLLHGGEVVAVDPDDQVGCRWGVGRGEALVRVAPDLGAHSGVARGDLCDGGRGLFLIGVRGDPHPQLGGVHVHHLLRRQCPADLGPDLADGLEGADLPREQAGDAVHLRQ